MSNYVDFFPQGGGSGMQSATVLNQYHSTGSVSQNLTTTRTLDFTPTNYRTVAWEIYGTAGGRVVVFNPNYSNNYFIVPTSNATLECYFTGNTTLSLTARSSTASFYIRAVEYDMNILNSTIISTSATNGTLPFTIVNNRNVYCTPFGPNPSGGRFFSSVCKHGFMTNYSTDNTTSTLATSSSTINGVSDGHLWITDASTYTFTQNASYDFYHYVVEFEVN